MQLFEISKTYQRHGLLYKVIGLSECFVTYLDLTTPSGEPKKCRAKLHTTANGLQYFLSKAGWQVWAIETQADESPRFLIA
jgi:hypothetical protein